ncbi:hypothetical protein CBS101457_003522 [Exobasidium rhododendri]|nr:hypothetical protein CBS101457_003522 [Exobasidium rhododendri]
MASTSSAANPASATPSPAFAASSPAQRLRRLIWEATIPIVVTVECGDLPQISLDRSIETYYVKAPRISYLPLVLQEVKSNLLALMVDDEVLRSMKEEEFWFLYEGTPLRWHWPIGLLYDYHTANTGPSSYRSSMTSGSSMTGAMQRLPTTTVTDSTAPEPRPLQINQAQSQLPWQLTLRIGNAPLEKIHSSPGLDNCRTSYMSMLKEADFVRWGSTKRVTNLRKTEQDALWEGVVTHNFELYWSVASKIIPSMPTSEGGVTNSHQPRTPSTATITHNGEKVGGRSSLTHQHNESQASLHSTAPSDSGASGTESNTHIRSSNNQYRSLPMRFFLLQGIPVVQEPISPYTEDGRPITLHSVLSALFPLLVPPMPTFSTSPSQIPPPPMAYAVIQGIRIPFEAEIPWIGSALSSADGW